MLYRGIAAMLVLAACAGTALNQDEKVERRIVVIVEDTNSARTGTVYPGKGVSGELLALSFERLYQWAPSESGAVLKPWIAADWPEVSKDGLRHRITLRKEATFGAWDRFTEGKARRIDVDDVFFTLRWLVHRSAPKAGETGSSSGTHHFDSLLRGRIEGLDSFATLAAAHRDWGHDLQTSEIAGLRRVDQYTFELRLTRPCGYLPMILAHPALAVLPFELASNDRGEYDPFAMQAASGPMTWRREGDTKTHWQEKRADYWGEQPTAEPIVYEEMPSLNDWMAGKVPGVELYWEVPLKDFHEARTRLAKSPQYHEGDTEQLHILAFNTERKLFAGDGGRKLRIAISDFLPRDTISEVSRRSEPWRVSRNLLPPVSGLQYPKYAELPAAMTKEAARAAVLACAGAVVPDEAGCVLDFTIVVAPSSLTKNGREAVQKSMAEIGIRAHFKLMSEVRLTETLATGDYDAVFTGWSNDWPDPLNLLSMLHSRNAGNVWPHTIGCRYRNEKFDALLEKAERESVAPASAASRDKLIQELLKMCADDLPYAPVAVPQRGWVASSGLEVPKVPQSAGVTYRFLKRKD